MHPHDTWYLWLVNLLFPQYQTCQEHAIYATTPFQAWASSPGGTCASGGLGGPRNPCLHGFPRPPLPSKVAQGKGHRLGGGGNPPEEGHLSNKMGATIQVSYFSCLTCCSFVLIASICFLAEAPTLEDNTCWTPPLLPPATGTSG